MIANAAERERTVEHITTFRASLEALQRSGRTDDLARVEASSFAAVLDDLTAEVAEYEEREQARELLERLVTGAAGLAVLLADIGRRQHVDTVDLPARLGLSASILDRLGGRQAGEAAVRFLADIVGNLVSDTDADARGDRTDPPPAATA